MAPIKLAGRSLSKLLRSATRRTHYAALTGMMLRCPDFVEVLPRYLLGCGGYPATVRVRARGRVLEIPLDSYHDLLTVNEVFFRRDYRASPLATTVVDVGSNVGISALYFLTLNERCRVYLYEPVPRNLQRLRVNLRGFEGRWRVDAVAVGTRSGVVEFGWEASGRYGGVGRRLPHRMHVACRDINDVLAEVIAERGAIDVLKVDVEGTESALIRHIDPTHLMRIGAIYAECDGRSLDLPGFRRRQWGSVARFRRSVS